MLSTEAGDAGLYQVVSSSGPMTGESGAGGVVGLSAMAGDGFENSLLIVSANPLRGG